MEVSGNFVVFLALPGYNIPYYITLPMSTDLGRKGIPEIPAFHMANDSKLDFGEIMVPSTEKAFGGMFTLWGPKPTEVGQGKFQIETISRGITEPII